MEPTARASAGTKPMAFPAPPKSALFDRLNAFLPVLANENKKLEAAIANGEGDRHNIEIAEPDDAKATAADDDSEDEDEDDESDDDMDGSNAPSKKAPVIEMNFALGLMEEGGSDADSSDDDDDNDNEIDLAATIAMARGPQSTASAADGTNGLQLPTTNQKPSPATRPLIQELN